MFFRKNLLLILAISVNISAFSQVGDVKTIEKSISLEFAYQDVKPHDIVGQMMFAKIQYYTYGDADYFWVRKFSSNPDPKSLDAVVVDLVLDRKSGKSFSLFQIAGKKLMTEDEPIDGQTMASKFMASIESEPVKVGNPTFKIQELPAEKWTTKVEEGMDAPIFYTVPSVLAGDALKDLPFFMNFNGKQLGLYVGNDSKMLETYALRAEKIEFDQPKDVKAMIAGFKVSSKEEVNQEIKNLLGF